MSPLLSHYSVFRGFMQSLFLLLYRPPWHSAHLVLWLFSSHGWLSSRESNSASDTVFLVYQSSTYPFSCSLPRWYQSFRDWKTTCPLIGLVISDKDPKGQRNVILDPGLELLSVLWCEFPIVTGDNCTFQNKPESYWHSHLILKNVSVVISALGQDNIYF